MLVTNHIVPPKEWVTNPSKKYNFNPINDAFSTIAMLMAFHGLTIP